MDNIKLPTEVEAEIALIGCIFLDENVILEVGDLLTPDDFYDVKNKLIYRAMLELNRSGSHIDATTVISYLSNSNTLEQCGGTKYIASIADYSYSTENYESYIKLIEGASLKRVTISTLNSLVQNGYDPSVDCFDYIDNVESEVFELSKRRRVDSFRSIREVSRNVLDQAGKNANLQDDIIGLDTGFQQLNKITQGFQSGALIILAARPAMGKSAMALNLANNIALRNKDGEANVAFFSLEMSAEQLVERMLACDCNIRLNQIKNGHMSKTEWLSFNNGCDNLSKMNLYFDDSAGSSIASIRAKCRKQKADGGLDFVVIDYLQLIEGDNARQTQLEKVSKITRSLKLMARELEVPVLALSQLSRAVEQRDDKKPIMADLRDSGSIEQDADIVMFLYREDYYNSASQRKGEADLIVAKNRSGSTSEGIPLIFAPEYQKFRDKKED